MIPPVAGASACHGSSSQESPSFHLLSATAEEDSSLPLAQRQAQWPVVPSSDGIKSFADAVMAGLRIPGKSKCCNAFKYPLPQSFENIHAGLPGREEMVEVKEITSLNGRPCVYLSDDELNILGKPLELSLIGKFSQGRPKWINLNRYFMDLRLLGAYKIASLDSRHFVIHLNTFEDYTKIFSKPVATIKGHVVKYFKWTMDFDVNNEPSITPIWISMSLLKMSMFTQNMLFSIAKAYGKPLLIDPTTALGNNPGMARVLVEMDVLVDQPKDVWIGNKVNGYAQVVDIENKPKYCSHCRKYGHMMKECYMKHPELNQHPKKYEWQPKEARTHVNERQATSSANGSPESSNKAEDEPPSGEPCQNRTISLENQKEEHARKFWDKYKEQIRLEEDFNIASKGNTQGNDKGDEPNVDNNNNVNGNGQADCCASLKDTFMNDKNIDENHKRAKEMADEVILKVTEQIYEECYNKAFIEENQVEEVQADCAVKPIVQGEPIPSIVSENIKQVNAVHEKKSLKATQNSMSGSDSTLAPNTHDDSKVDCNNKKMGKHDEKLVDTRNLTEANIFDLHCMGFTPDRSESEHEGCLDDTDDIPPHSKNRRRSWGDDENNEWTTIKHKKGRKKKSEVSIITSPRKTRGRTRDLKGKQRSEDDSL